jgi:asparagine synthase (glutamine-hydrolysing)
MKTRLPDHYILQYDRLMNAHGLDWRTPYLDKDLIEYAAAIPEPENESSTYLKDLYRGKFPDSLIDRPKKTRRNFLNSWVHKSELKELFPLLRNGTLVNTGLISKKWIEQMCERDETMESAFRFLFSVLILELWFKIYINRPLTFSAPKQSVRDLLSEI